MEFLDTFVDTSFINDAVDYMQQFPLHYACALKPVEKIQSQLETESKNINQKDDGGFTPFLVAVTACRKLDVLQLLLDKGAVLTDTLADGQTCLYLAIEYNQPEVVQFLLNAKADPQGSIGIKSPLYLAVGKGCENIVESLLNAKADPNV